MPSRKARGSRSLAVKAVELAFAVPQVVAHRITRMALSGPKLSARDRKEFERMVAEKNAAFVESWIAMTARAAVPTQALAASFFRSFLSVARGKKHLLPQPLLSFGGPRSACWARALRRCIARPSPMPSAWYAQSFANRCVG